MLTYEPPVFNDVKAGGVLTGNKGLCSLGGYEPPASIFTWVLGYQPSDF